MTDKAIVIGSGAAGLAAAAVLGSLDHEVVVIDRTRRSSPLLRGFAREGHYCDVGLHYSGGLGPGGMLSWVFAGLGVAHDIEPVALDPEGFDRIVWPERDLYVAVPNGLDAVTARLCEAFPESSQAVDAYMGVVRHALGGTPFLNPDVPPWNLQRSPYEKVDLAPFLLEAGAGDDLIGFLGLYGETLCGLTTDEAPLLTHAMVLGSYFASAHTVRGGGRAVADAFLRRFSELGVSFLGGRPVAEIVIGGEGRATGVRLADGELLEASLVVFTPHPALLPGMLRDERLRAPYLRRLAKMESTPGMFLSYVVGEPKSPAKQHNSYLFFNDPDHVDRGASQLALMAGSPPSDGLASSHCLIRGVTSQLFDRGSCGPDGSRDPAYLEAKQRLHDDSLSRVRRDLGELDADVRVLETVSPLSFSDWTGTENGSAYGLKRLSRGKKLHAQTPVPNLFLAGQGTLYPGIMGTVASALVACCHAVGAERTWSVLSR